jgi:hypothetical protein
MPKSFKKDERELLDYVFNWEEWLDGDTISSYTVDVSGITLDDDTGTTTAVTVWLDAGSATTALPSCACSIVTAAGRESTRTMTFDMVTR